MKPPLKKKIILKNLTSDRPRLATAGSISCEARLSCHIDRWKKKTLLLRYSCKVICHPGKVIFVPIRISNGTCIELLVFADTSAVVHNVFSLFLQLWFRLGPPY